MIYTFKQSIALLIGIVIFTVVGLSAQSNVTTMKSVVNDENGNPVKDAEIYSGRSYSKTDASGTFTIDLESDAKVIVEANGFETQTLTHDEAINRTIINLKTDSFMYGTNDQVQVAFRKKKEGEVVGFVSEVNTKKIKRYDQTIWANDILAGRTLGLYGNK